MTDAFRTIQDYELFLYTLAERFPSVQRSTLALIRRAPHWCVTGELNFARGIRLVVRERILYHRLPAVLDWYGYEVWHGEEKLFWYDSQPHSDDPNLQSTYPHHKHVPPDMKHNRIPAPSMSFVRPNLPALIEEIEDTIKKMAES